MTSGRGRSKRGSQKMPVSLVVVEVNSLDKPGECLRRIRRRCSQLPDTPVSPGEVMADAEQDTTTMLQRYGVLILFVFLLAVPRRGYGQDYAIGADVSFLGQVEQRGVVFEDEGKGQPCLQILKNHGYNWIRLRLFHTPA